MRGAEKVGIQFRTMFTSSEIEGGRTEEILNTSGNTSFETSFGSADNDDDYRRIKSYISKDGPDEEVRHGCET